MAEKNYLRKLFVFQSYECAAVEEFLAKMASEGWMLDSIKGSAFAPYVFVFHKEQPQKISFSVDYFQWGSIYDEKPYIPTQEYIAYCEKEGWHYVCTKGKMQIFYTERANPASIQTDESIKFRAINNVFFRQNIYVWPLLLLAWLFFYQVNSNFENFITSSFWIISLTAYVLSLIISIFIFIDYFRWRIQSVKNLRTIGRLNLEFRKKWATPLQLKFILICYFLLVVYAQLPKTVPYMFLYVGFVASFGFLVIYFDYYYEKRNHSSGSNRLHVIARFIFIFYMVFMINISIQNSLGIPSFFSDGWASDEAIEPYIITLPDDEDNRINYSGNRMSAKETFLAKMSTYVYYFNVSGKFDSKRIRVYVFETPYDWISNKMLKDRINSKDDDFALIEEDPTSWGVDSLYRMDGDNNKWKDVIVLEDEDKVFVLESEIEIKYSNEEIYGIKRLLQGM
ncbi:MAG TPA: hypothetical protein DHN33_05675 [Eubacteriaceae bacterium]|nr:hypothetical protein [Eubacteriaceae bacterium]